MSQLVTLGLRPAPKTARPPWKVPQMPRMCICMGADSKVMAKNGCKGLFSKRFQLSKKSFSSGERILDATKGLQDAGVRGFPLRTWGEGSGHNAARDLHHANDPVLRDCPSRCPPGGGRGLEYGPAKRGAVKLLALPARTPLPGNEVVEDAVREHIALFCADTQPAELRALRRVALGWMDRMAAFRPHLGGAVWHGTATRMSDIYLQLFCDDPKSAEIALIDHGVSYETGMLPGLHGQPVDTLSVGLSRPNSAWWWACIC